MDPWGKCRSLQSLRLIDKILQDPKNKECTAMPTLGGVCGAVQDFIFSSPKPETLDLKP